MCGEIHSFGSNVSSEVNSEGWEHNIWNPLLDALAEYRSGLVLEFLQDATAGRVGLTSHFALDVITHATAK